MNTFKMFTCFCFLFPSVVSPCNPLISNPVAKWKFQTNGPVRGGVVSSGENIFFGSSDGYLYSINKITGLLVWKFQTQGAITSSPALTTNSVIVTSRDNFVYAVNLQNGQLIWKFQMQPPVKFEMEWDYNSASPVVLGKQVLIGSGDSHLYALSLDKGKVLWKFKTNGRIRATPLVVNDVIYQPSFDGFVYVINAKNGEEHWKYKTYGTTLDGKKSGYDRTSIFSSPRLADSLLVFGSRDGLTYCVNVFTHKKKWHFFYDGTWAMSAPILDAGTAYVGWSTNFTFCALDMTTGKERWNFKARGVFYGTPILSGDEIIAPSGDGKLYCISKQTGKPVWEYLTGGSIFSSPLIDNKMIYIGSDDGALYCLKDCEKAQLAVYDAVPRNAMFSGAFSTESTVTPYLKERGFEHLDSAKLHRFLLNRIQDKMPSAIVFVYQYVPDNIMGEDPGQGLLRKYLESGGKVVWFGDIPKRYPMNEKGQFTGVDNTVGPKLLNIIIDHDWESGNYYCKSTQEGLNWGLPSWLTATYGSVSPEGVIPLAINEYGKPAIWIRKFNDSPGSGFVSCRTWPWHTPFPESSLAMIYRVAIYGLK